MVEIHMVGRGVRRMQGLERLTGLHKASFARNEISHIQGLDACTALQELSFEARCLDLPCIYDSRLSIQDRHKWSALLAG